jgi:glycosyltransferase involved in cell wall biosynthesis
MKWLIVEDALRDRKGHWMEYVSTFVRGLRTLGDAVEVLCDRNAEGFILEQTGARPVLPDSIWHRMGDGVGAMHRYLRVPWHAIATFVAMRRVFNEFSHREYSVEDRGVSHGVTVITELPPSPASLPATSYPPPATSIPPDWIFVPTVMVHHLLGWWLLLKTGVVPRESRVLLFFPNLPIRLDDVGCSYWNTGPTTKLMAWIFASVRTEVESGRVVLGVETHSMQRSLEGLIQMPVAYLPHPVEFHAETRRRGGKENLTTEDTESTEDYFVNKQGDALRSQAGAAFSNLSTSKLARDCENTSLTRSASGPASSPVTSYPPPATSAKPIVFGCYGAARWEKGSDIFQEAIKLILKNQVPVGASTVASGKSQIQPVTSYQLLVTAAGRPLRFAIQWVEDFRDEVGNLVAIDPWLKNHPQVEVIGRYFQGDEYLQQLAGTDVMVLPYRSPYRLRVSRVVIEAMIHGMPVIATQGSTLFEQAKEYGVAVCCEDGSAESLAEAIFEVAEGFERMKFTAMDRATTAATSFSVVYFRELLHNF